MAEAERDAGMEEEEDDDDDDEKAAVDGDDSAAEKASPFDAAYAGHTAATTNRCGTR